jgi:bacillithiol system protein YtxJ
MERIRTQADFERLAQSELAVVLKHSTMCPVSTGAHREVDSFVVAHPEVAVHKVHVIEDRALSNYIEECTGVRHESPQVIVLRDGDVVWHVSHFAVTAEALAERVRARGHADE